MESAFSTLGFVIFSLWISIYAIVVESNGGHVGSELSSFTSPSRPSRSPLRHSPPPPIFSSPQKKHPHSPPSPNGPKKDIYERSRPPLPPPPLRSPQPPAPPLQPPPAPPDQTLHWNAQETKRQSPSHQMNAGKALGLFFLVMAAFTQIVVVVFLVFKRRQLLKATDIYETGS